MTLSVDAEPLVRQLALFFPIVLRVRVRQFPARRPIGAPFRGANVRKTLLCAAAVLFAGGLVNAGTPTADNIEPCLFCEGSREQAGLFRALMQKD